MTTRKVSVPLSHLHSLVRTVEFDVVLGDDSFVLRVELFQDKIRRRTFRANVWRTEFYRIQSTFPQNPSTGQPEHQPSDEVILVDWSTNVPGKYSAFKAANSTEALNMVLKAIRGALDRASEGKVERRR